MGTLDALPLLQSEHCLLLVRLPSSLTNLPAAQVDQAVHEPWFDADVYFPGCVNAARGEQSGLGWTRKCSSIRNPPLAPLLQSAHALSRKAVPSTLTNVPAAQDDQLVHEPWFAWDVYFPGKWGSGDMSGGNGRVEGVP